MSDSSVYHSKYRNVIEMKKRIKRACTVLLIGLFGFTLSGCMEADEIKDAIESALSDDSTAITVNGVEYEDSYEYAIYAVEELMACIDDGDKDGVKALLCSALKNDENTDEYVEALVDGFEGDIVSTTLYKRFQTPNSSYGEGYNSAFMNLESGAVDAICMDIGVANYEIEARGNNFSMLDERLSSEEYGIGFKLGNTQLRDTVQTTLLEMLDDGTYDEIAKKWGLEESICLSHDEVNIDETGTADGSAKKEPSFLEKFTDITKQISEGFLASLSIFVLTLVFSLPLGLLVCAGRMCRFKPIQWIVKLYISIVRGTPLMLQLLVVFFGPHYLFGIHLSPNYRFYAVIIGFSVNYAAYFAEIYRSGIQAVPHGQYEACAVLGYSKSQTFFRIIFPQMVKNIIPSVTNEVITLVKDTSLAFALSYTEMFTIAKQVAASKATIMPLFIAGVFYYIFNFIVAFIMERIEKKMSYFR